MTTRVQMFRSILNDYFAHRPTIEQLQKYCNEQMAAYEEREEHKRQELLKRSKVPDDEGFITVFNPSVHEVTMDSGEQFVGLDNFYKFQTKQSKLNELEELRRKFEQDKQKIALLKKNKLFL